MTQRKLSSELPLFAQPPPPPCLQSLPLVTRPTPADKLGLTIAYAKAQIGHIMPPAMALVMSILMLLGFLLWRAFKLCCGGGRLKTGAQAAALLRGRQASWIKALLVLSALGAIAGGAYGLSQASARVG